MVRKEPFLRQTPAYFRVLACLAACLAVTGHAAAPEPWARWRGAEGAGQGGDTLFPHTWTDADWAWTADLPGRGHASPVVLASMAHGLTAVDPATGAVRWERRCLPKRAVSSPLVVGE